MNNTNQSSLYVSPSSETVTSGASSNIFIGVRANGNKVCVAEGTVVFNNLSCSDISVADGVVTQTAPSCSNPHFVVGVQDCTTADKVLVNITVKAGGVGPASVNATAVDIIGEGVSVGGTVVSGNYTIEPRAMVETPIAPVVSKTIASTSPAMVSTTSTSIENQAAAAVTSNSSPVVVFLVVILIILGAIGYFISKKAKLNK